VVGEPVDEVSVAGDDVIGEPVGDVVGNEVDVVATMSLVPVGDAVGSYLVLLRCGDQCSMVRAWAAEATRVSRPTRGCRRWRRHALAECRGYLVTCEISRVPVKTVREARK
jgi:hypothetical protein